MKISTSIIAAMMHLAVLCNGVVGDPIIVHAPAGVTEVYVDDGTGAFHYINPGHTLTFYTLASKEFRTVLAISKETGMVTFAEPLANSYLPGVLSVEFPTTAPDTAAPVYTKRAVAATVAPVAVTVAPVTESVAATDAPVTVAPATEGVAATNAPVTVAPVTEGVVAATDAPTTTRVNSAQYGVVVRTNGGKGGVTKNGLQTADATNGKRTNKSKKSVKQVKAGKGKGGKSLMYKTMLKKSVQKEQMIGGILGVACAAVLVVGIVHKTFSNSDNEEDTPLLRPEYGSMTDRIAPVSPKTQMLC